MRRAATILALVLLVSTSGCAWLLPKRPDGWMRNWDEKVEGVSIEEAGWENGGYDRDAWRARMRAEWHGHR